MGKTEVLCSIALYESRLDQLEKCLESLAGQDEFPLGERLEVLIIENSPHRLDTLPAANRPGIDRITNRVNLGFCGAHNQAAHRFLASDARYWLLLNPDLRLERGALAAMCGAIDDSRKIGSVCGKLYRADERLEPIVPATIDSAGMFVTPDLRHLDRGSNLPDGPELDRRCFVFGGTGACLLLSRAFVEALVLEGTAHDGDKSVVARQLAEPGGAPRAQLFDEAFFAYREDADLAWRGQLLGWRCLYEPRAVGYHERRVVPERRSLLPEDINRHGVRNRFLLQLNNFKLGSSWHCVVPGLLIRNLLVILAVLLCERSSLAGLVQVWRLIPRALERRREISKRTTSRAGAWFRREPYVEY